MSGPWQERLLIAARCTGGPTTLPRPLSESTAQSNSNGEGREDVLGPRIKRLALRVARESAVGHLRIQGEMLKLGITVASATIWEILHATGIGPAPRRAGPTWRQFLRIQAAGILAVDFLHVDTVTLKRLCVLLFIEDRTRRMHLGGVTINPADGWTVQQARNLAFTPGQRFADMRFLIRDRGPEFTASFDAVFPATGTRILVTAAQAPRMNVICARLAGTLRHEVPGRILIPR